MTSIPRTRVIARSRCIQLCSVSLPCTMNRQTRISIWNQKDAREQRAVPRKPARRKRTRSPTLVVSRSESRLSISDVLYRRDVISTHVYWRDLYIVHHACTLARGYPRFRPSHRYTAYVPTRARSRSTICQLSGCLVDLIQERFDSRGLDISRLHELFQFGSS